MQKINVTQGKRYTFRTHINEILLPREEAECLEAFRVIVEPGRRTHRHVHGDTEQLYHVISGAGAAHCDYADGRRATLTMAPGDVLHIPRNTWHEIVCTGGEPLVYLCVDAFPGGKPADEPTWEAHYRAVQRLQSRMPAAGDVAGDVTAGV
jgi:mannose-6-phosphate isomerase-like protein (cupin superfamily)